MVSPGNELPEYFRCLTTGGAVRRALTIQNERWLLITNHSHSNPSRLPMTLPFPPGRSTIVARLTSLSLVICAGGM